MLRTHTCGELRKKHKGKKVVLAGWAHNIRVFGNKAFVDLRDRYGIVQLVLDKKFKDIYAGMTRESVLVASGKVRLRKEPNQKIETGEVEIVIDTLAVASKASPMPFEIFNPSVESTEETRLKYRYLDLRRAEMLRMLEFRFKAEMIVRNYFSLKDFVEVETPFLSRPTPEGARDFLVPTRNKGLFWALPQSPQQYKQLLMVAGVDKYFQIVRCFRDEDLRKDRQYEFTQIDAEMSFVTEEDVMNVTEGMISVLYSQLLGIKLPKPFTRLTWREAMDLYGSDKPDTRFDMKLEDYSDDFRDSGFLVFEKEVDKGGVVKGIRVPEILSRSDVEKLESIVKREGFKGLAWMKSSKELSGPLASRIPEKSQKKFVKKNGTFLLLAGDWLKVCTALGNVRIAVADQLGLCKGLGMLWVTEFPLFEWSETEKRVRPMHHPFTSPRKDAEADLDPQAPSERLLQIPARAYDLVINGVEVGGGSIRITERTLQEKMFEVLGIGREEAQEKFGMLLEAFGYGAPPHGGIAFGFDRLLQVMLGKDSIRDVLAFPKSKSGRALMEGAPAEADKAALEELGVSVEKD